MAPTQLPDFTLQLGQALGVIGRGAGPEPVIDLGLTDPVAQGLGMDPQLIGDALCHLTRGLRILPGERKVAIMPATSAVSRSSGMDWYSVTSARSVVTLLATRAAVCIVEERREHLRRDVAFPCRRAARLGGQYCLLHPQPIPRPFAPP